MNLSEASAAIEAIVAAIDDDDLPEFDRVEIRDGVAVVWYGGRGNHLGSATSGGQRDPGVYRRQASRDAIHAEMLYRADERLLALGDDVTQTYVVARRRSA